MEVLRNAVSTSTQTFFIKTIGACFFLSLISAMQAIVVKLSLVLDSSEKIPQDEYFVFYNNLSSPDGSVVHQGDNLTGEGDGDDETIFIDLDKINPKIERLVVVVTIHEAQIRRQNFGQVENSFIRLYDIDTNKEIAKYELDEDFSTETAVEFGELYKKSGSWRFKAVGVGFNAGLQGFVDKFVR